MTRYASGRRKEWAARKMFEKNGYRVTRSAGSKGLVDLVAIDKDRVVLAQIKYTTKGGWVDANWKRLMEEYKMGLIPKCARIVAVVYTRGTSKPELFWGVW